MIHTRKSGIFNPENFPRPQLIIRNNSPNFNSYPLNQHHQNHRFAPNINASIQNQSNIVISPEQNPTPNPNPNPKEYNLNPPKPFINSTSNIVNPFKNIK